MSQQSSPNQYSLAIADKPLIWSIVIIFPFTVFGGLKYYDFSTDISIFIAIVSLSLIIWIFSLMPDFIPALLAMLLLLLFGLAPHRIVLSGFSSSAFLVAFSIMGLGAVISSSGLARRYTLWLLKTIPDHSFAHQFTLFFTSLIFNPIVPTITGRVVLMTPILNSVIQKWDENARQKSSTVMYLSVLDGINYLSPIFLTAAPANLMIFGLLPSQEQQAFQFLFWMYAASVTGLILFVLYFVTMLMYFHCFHNVTIDHQLIEKERKQLGKSNQREKTALFSIALMSIAFGTCSLHKIPIPQITFAIICILLTLGVLSRDDFIQQIDWAFLSLMAGIIGLSSTMNYLGVDNILITQLEWLAVYMRSDFYFFVLILALVILVVRIIIPLNPAILIFAVALLPLAANAGISPWVVGFIILILSETAFFAHQSPYILYFRRLTRNHLSYNEKQVMIFHGLLVIVKLAAIYASIPFWLKIGIL
jgi:di/tricarboxylate transporter